MKTLQVIAHMTVHFNGQDYNILEYEQQYILLWIILAFYKDKVHIILHFVQLYAMHKSYAAVWDEEPAIVFSRSVKKYTTLFSSVAFCWNMFFNNLVTIISK